MVPVLVSISLLTGIALHSAPWISGKEWYEDIEVSYQIGEYGDLLKALDSKVQNQKSKEDNEATFAKSLSGERVNAIKENVGSYQKELSHIRSDADEKLKKFASENPSLPISKLINEALKNFSKDELDQIFALEFSQEDPSNPFLSMKKIAQEYFQKKQILYLCAAGIEKSLPFNPKLLKSYLTVLDLEMFQKMHLACQSNGNAALEAQLAKAESQYFYETSRQFAYQQLQSLGKTKQLSDPNEKKVAQIMLDFETKKKELMRK